MADILLRGGRVIDPARNFDANADVLLQDGKVARVEPASRRDPRTRASSM
jgi:predicted amidohydrolase